ALESQATSLRYIPIDISRGLLDAASRKLKGNAEIPVAILGDFEGGTRFLSVALNEYATHPILFSLLGGTIGNLDRGETSFFKNVLDLMRPPDHFLLDLPLAGAAWSEKTEPRLDKARYSEAFRSFL